MSAGDPALGRITPERGSEGAGRGGGWRSLEKAFIPEAKTSSQAHSRAGRQCG